MLDVTRLISRLYIGSRPERGKGLGKAGFDTVVLCAEEYQPKLKEFPGLQAVLHVPLDDHKPTEQEVEMAVQAAMDVADRYLAGEAILVTCQQGRNRSGLVAAMALHFITCAPPTRCIGIVQRERANALTNDYFVDLIRTVRVAC